MMEWIYRIPAGVLLFIALAAAIAIALGGQIAIHRRFPKTDFLSYNDVGGVIMTVAGTLYAVMVGFVTVVAWQHFTEARAIVVMEADADIDAWHTSVALPTSVREHVRKDVVNYANIMIGREWPLMREGRADPDAAMLGLDAIDAASTFNPANMAESNAQVATVQQLNVMHDARQHRISINDAGISWFEWLVLLIGAVCIICFCWLFGMHNPRVHLIMTGTVVAIIVSMLVLLLELEYPFRSNIGIQPTAWRSALTHIEQMQAVPHMDGTR